MNYHTVFGTVGKVLLVEAGLLVLPLVTSLLYQDGCATDFLIAIAAALLLGGLLYCLCRKNTGGSSIRDGFVIVSLAWLALSAVGAIPFVLSGEIPSFVDAFFEIVSGFTTTGASILADVEALSPSILFWRSFSHWVGGMGVLVFLVMLTGKNSDRSIHILRAEMPGPIVDKIVPRAQDTARTLYVIYLGMTLLLVLLLLAGGMSLFESLLHAFGTAGTGGFGIRNDSLASYSPYLQWVISIFMLLFGINFNLYYLLLLRRIRDFFHSNELQTYVAIIFAAVALITWNISPMYENVAEALRHAVFQTSSIITTTGFATADFNLWPSFSKAILFLLMFIGGCAGSTAGGLKVSRVVLLFQLGRQKLRQALHPRSVSVCRLDGRAVDEQTLSGVGAYFALYAFCIAALFLVMSTEPFDLETNLSAVVSCFNNVGPGLSAVGPTGNYSAYAPLTKILLSFAMLLGRLELYPLLLTLAPSTWKRHHGR